MKVRFQVVPRSLWPCDCYELPQITPILPSLPSKKKKSLHDMFKSLTHDSVGYFLPIDFAFDGYVQKN